MSHEITLVEHPPPYFKLQSNGRVHLVRAIQVVTWRGQTHRSVNYRCGNIINDDRGDLLYTLPANPTICGRCQGHRERVLVRPRYRSDDDRPEAGVVFDLEEDE